MLQLAATTAVYYFIATQLTAVATSPTPPTACVFHSDASYAHLYSAVRADGSLALLANLTEWQSFVEGLNTRVSSEVVGSWCVIGGRDVDEMCELTLAADGASATQATFHVAKVPGHAQDYVSEIEFDTASAAYVGVVDGYNRNNTPWLDFASWSRTGELLHVFEDITPVWTKWDGYVIGASAWNPETRTFFVVAFEGDANLIYAFPLPLSGPSPPPAVFNAPPSGSPLAMAYSASLGGLLVQTGPLDPPGGTVGNLTLWRQEAGGGWSRILSMPKEHSADDLIGSMDLTDDGSIAVINFVDSAERSTLLWVNVTSGEVIGRVHPGSQVTIVRFCNAKV
jgi:hypothetical protein